VRAGTFFTALRAFSREQSENCTENASRNGISVRRFVTHWTEWLSYACEPASEWSVFTNQKADGGNNASRQQGTNDSSSL